MTTIEKRPFGKTGMQVTALGFGGAEIGYDGATPDTVKQLLNSALDAGLNVVDTAECYKASEQMIGEAISHRRDEYHLFTKCGHEDGKGVWTKPSLLASIERSLKRLRTDRVDLIQLHSCGEDELRRGEVIEALQEARQKGYARFIGYSGDGDAAKFAIESEQFDALQTSLNVADQEAIDLTLPLARQRNMAVIIKRPIANAAWRYGNKAPEEPYHTEYWRRLQLLDYDFTKKPMHEAVAAALRFTLGQPGVSVAIVGTSKPGRWSENAQLLQDGPLSAAEEEAIRRRWKEVAQPDWVGQT